MEQFLGHDLGDCGIEKVEQGIDTGNAMDCAEVGKSSA
jgi:hypothetical protein